MFMRFPPGIGVRLRPGFTIVELLVVIAILGVLVGLLVPAVQAARESGRQMACRNNLRQLGLAIRNYEAARRTLPPRNTEPTAALPNAQRGSWVTATLPFFEEEAVRLSYVSDQHWHDASNVTAVATEIPILHCPATPPRMGFEWTVLVTWTGPTQYTLGPREFYPGATTDYSNVGGIGKVLNTTLNQPVTDPLNCGALTPNAGRRLGEIVDGTTKTFLLVECSGRPNLYQKGRLVPDGTMPKTWAGSSSIKRPFPTGGVWASHLKGFLIDGAGDDGTTATVPGTCAVNCSNDNEVYSFHPNGAAALMCDGSVRLLQASLAIDVLAALSSCNGSEVTDD